MTEKKSNEWFNYFIFFGMLISVLAVSILKIQRNPGETTVQIIAAVGAMFGVTSTILAAKGNILNFVIGGLGAIIETYLLWRNGTTSMFLLYMFYFIPMDIVGFISWKKKGASARKEVHAQRMDGKKWGYAALGYVAAVGVAFAVSFFSAKNSLGSAIPAKMITDALATGATIIAIVMMTFAYVEQWYVWTLVNISNIALWAVAIAAASSSGDDTGYAIVMLIKYVFYFINGINGIRIWLKLSRAE